MPNEDDKKINHFRQWIYHTAGGGPVWGSIRSPPKRLSPTELFDVFNSHTKNCIVCQKALKNIKIFRNINLLLSLISIIQTKHVFKNILFTGFFSVIAYSSHKLVGMFYQYHYSHQNNN
jgi:hypothetical protein